MKKVEPLHMCCDICEKLCKCDNTNCPETHPALQFKMDGMESESMKRSVNDREKTAVRQIYEQKIKYDIPVCCEMISKDL